MSIKQFSPLRLARKSIFVQRSRKSLGDHINSQKNVSRYKKFIMLEKKNEENEIIDFYRLVKEKMKTCINRTESKHETVR